MSAGPFTDDTVWRADLDNLILCPFGDVTLAFHRLSGDTHVLNFLSEAVLKVLSNGEETLVSIVPKVIEEIQVPADECPNGVIEQTLLQLDEIGLVAPQADAI